MFHGGKNYSSGIDLTQFLKAKGINKEFFKIMEHKVNNIMVRMILALAKSVKPTVFVIRGHSVGLSFTT